MYYILTASQFSDLDAPCRDCFPSPRVASDGTVLIHIGEYHDQSLKDIIVSTAVRVDDIDSELLGDKWKSLDDGPDA